MLWNLISVGNEIVSVLVEPLQRSLFQIKTIIFFSYMFSKINFKSKQKRKTEASNKNLLLFNAIVASRNFIAILANPWV